MTFGEKLLELRKQNNFSQEELAEKIGVSRQAVSRWESGETMPDSPNLLIICNLFGVSADSLLRDEIETQKQEAKPPEHKATKKNKLFVFYILALFGMSVFLYGIALSYLDIIYWIAGTIFLVTGIITSIAYFKGKLQNGEKDSFYLVASILFFIAAIIAILTGQNVFFILGFPNFLIGTVLLLIYLSK